MGGVFLQGSNILVDTNPGCNEYVVTPVPVQKSIDSVSPSAR